MSRLASAARLLALALLLAALWLTLRYAPGRAQPASDAVEVLAAALRHVVSEDGRWPVAHCRQAGPRIVDGERWARCDRRLHAFAELFIEAGAEHRVDPYLLAAMASRESGLHPWARGGVGEVGILQLHPRGPGRAVVRLLDRPGARARCDARADACQRPVVEHGAAYLRRCIDRCGDKASALGAYNRGRCGETSYSRRVLSRRDQLQAWAAGGAS